VQGHDPRTRLVQRSLELREVAVTKSWITSWSAARFSAFTTPAQHVLPQYDTAPIDGDDRLERGD
jgi:hypothetical protein